MTVRIRRRLEAAFGDGAHLRDHSSLHLGEDNLPEPDVAVVRGHEDEYLHRLPGGEEVLLVVEISVSSQRRDVQKMALYARFGVAEAWVVDVPGRTLTVCREPSTQGYVRVEMLRPDDRVRVPGADLRWLVASLLP